MLFFFFVICYEFDVTRSNLLLLGKLDRLGFFRHILTVYEFSLIVYVYFLSFLENSENSVELVELEIRNYENTKNSKFLT